MIAANVSVCEDNVCMGVWVFGMGVCCVSVQDQAHHVTLSDLKFSANFSGAKKCMPFPHRHNSHFLLHPAPRCEICETKTVKRVVERVVTHNYA